MKTILLFSLMLLSCTTRNTKIEKNNALTGKVIKIVDGDTFDLLTDDKTTIRIRMNGIDCPERKQDYYQVCKDALAEYIFGKDVKLITHGKDRYTRTIADVFYKNENMNLKMIQNGFAWHYKKYSSNLIMAKAEEDARRKKIGLWTMDNAIAPWDYRKFKKQHLNGF
jgi:endonuclease YncB( thermonuclease family)